MAAARRVVIKVGSAQLIDPASLAPREDRFDALADDIARLRQAGQDVVLVSSAAVALGRPRLGLKPGQTLTLEEKQAAAAAGQALLIQHWDRAFARHGFPAAQALVSPADIESRPRWLNARNTLETLLKLGAVPVINENDTVATAELRFGDNDRLAARAAQLVGAQLLIILSDVDGLYDRDPREPNAAHIPEITAITPAIEALAGPARSEGAGTGGMASKIAAARIANAAGCDMIICRGDHPYPVQAIANGARASWFHAHGNPESARRAWILGSLAREGALVLDDGAAAAIAKGRSLLPAGVVDVQGRFERGAAVRLVTQSGQRLGVGVIGYDDHEARQIAGRQSDEITGILGYRRGAALVHATDLVPDPADGSPA